MLFVPVHYHTYKNLDFCLCSYTVTFGFVSMCKRIEIYVPLTEAVIG